LYPNVRDANEPDEARALDDRYQRAKAIATARGVSGAVQDFEDALTGSVAVIARSINELERLASNDDEIYATYYELIDGGVRSHRRDTWSVRRALADEALFPGYKDHIRFGALTLNGLGLTYYGACSLVLREEMIAHRASVFEENSTIFMGNQQIEMDKADQLPKGYRASWENRAKLCIAKLANQVDDKTDPDRYSELLVQQEGEREDANFVEVHIYGSLTRRTLERVIVSEPLRDEHRIIVKALMERLSEANVQLEVR
jgi:hypothetical protein